MKTENLKYRAWDNTDKVMKFFDFYKIHCGAYHPYHWKDSTGLACELDDPIRYPNELMQYIGLKDKNNKKGYSSDVVKYLFIIYKSSDPNSEGVKFEGIGIIVFIDGAFMVNPINKENPIPLHYNELSFEIIGNVYENKELLNEK